MDDFRPTIGRWWASHTPENQVVGYLNLDSEGIGPWQLSVDGELAEDTPPGYDTHLTIYGVTPHGKYTILRAGTGLIREGETVMQEWRGWQLIHGDHVTEQQHFPRIAFRLPGLWNWIGPSKLNYHTFQTRDHFRAKPEDEPTFLTAQLSPELQLNLGPAFVGTTGDTSESWNGYGIYLLQGNPGATLQQFEQVELALARLHAILAAAPMQAYEIELATATGPTFPILRVLDPHPPAGLDWGGHRPKDPFLDTAEIEFETFINAWIRLHAEAMGAVAVAAPRDDQQFLTSKLLDTCNGLEALAVHLWDRDRPGLQPDDEHILSTLKDARVSGELRRYIKKQLIARHWTLEDKLIRLAATVGPDSSTWLLGSSIRDWARLVGRLRNSLTHGSRLPGGLSDDIPFIATAHRSTAAILQLALLRQAGYDNPLSSSPGELLYSNGRQTVGHPNSRFFHELKAVAEYAQHWSQWRTRLESATHPS